MSSTFVAKFYTTQHKNGFLAINNEAITSLGSKTEVVKVSIHRSEKSRDEIHRPETTFEEIHGPERSFEEDCFFYFSISSNRLVQAQNQPAVGLSAKLAKLLELVFNQQTILTWGKT